MKRLWTWVWNNFATSYVFVLVVFVLICYWITGQNFWTEDVSEEKEQP